MQSSEKFADAPAAQVLCGIALIFPRTLFYEKTAKTLCVTIRNFAQFYFVYLYAKITRFLINERRTYPYIQVGSFSVPSLAPLAPARKPCGYARRRVTFCAPYFACLHTDFRQFYSIRNFAEIARKSRCSPLNRLAKQRDNFCGPAFFACGFRILSGRLCDSLYFRQRFLRIVFVYLHNDSRLIFRDPTPRKRDILIFRVIRFAY